MRIISYRKTNFFLLLAPILLRTIEACAPLIITSNQSGMLAYVFIKFSLSISMKFVFYSSLLDSELSSYLTLHPPIAKRALYCICALHPNQKDEILLKMIDVTKRNRIL
jgi:hypothetical protein